MRSEKDKMLGGERYDPLDPQLSAERRRARLLCKALNDTRDDQQEERARLIRALIPVSGQDIWIEPPFYRDYGSHITLGDQVFPRLATRADTSRMPAAATGRSRRGRLPPARTA